MSFRLAHLAIVTTISVAGLTAFSFLVVHDPSGDLTMHLPGQDGRPPAPGHGSASIDIGALFQAYDGRPSQIAASWPRFRGALMDNESREQVRLMDRFPPGGPALLWSVQLGEGHAGAAVEAGRVYVLDHDESLQADLLRCFSLDDGREIWRRGYRVRLKRNHGISRTVPAVSGRYVVSMGPSCQVMCVEAAGGGLLWGIDLPTRFAAEVPLWYTGQCPLIDGPQAVIAVGGQALLAGVDLATGQIAWQTPNPRGLKMSHSSIMLMTIAGVRTYVYAAIGGIVGVAAEPGTSFRPGDLLWESGDFDATVIAPSPVRVGEDRIFQTAGYGAGSIMLQVGRAGDSFRVRTLYRHRPTEGLACEQQTPVLHDGQLLGIMPKDAGALRSQLVCWHPQGRPVWSSGEADRFGLGPYLLADGKLLLLDDEGILHLIEASQEGYRPLDSARVLEGPDCWAPMALVDGRLIARDTRRMVCVDLRNGG